MQTSEVNALVDQYPEHFRTLGAIFYMLNRIEIHLITILTAFFAGREEEKNVILNDFWFHRDITMDTKRQLLEQVIKNVARVATEKSLPFDKKGPLGTCRLIAEGKEVRNKLAHHFLSFLPDGKVSYSVRKSNEERLNDQKAGKPGTTKAIEFDLQKELENITVTCDQAEKQLSKFVGEAWRILSA